MSFLRVALAFICALVSLHPVASAGRDFPLSLNSRPALNDRPDSPVSIDPDESIDRLPLAEPVTPEVSPATPLPSAVPSPAEELPPQPRYTPQAQPHYTPQPRHTTQPQPHFEPNPQAHAVTDPAWSAVDESAGFANVAIDLADHDFESGGYFLQYDHAIWSFSTPDSTTIGDKASERIVSVNGITYTHRNSLSTDFITRGHDRNNRWEFGHSGGRHGWLATYIRANDDQAIEATGVSFVPRDPQFLLGGYQDADEDGIDDDLDLDNIYGRSGQDLGTPDAGSPTGFSAPFDGTIDAAAPIDTGDLVLYLATFDNFVARNSVQLRGVELMGTWRLSRPESHAGGFELYYGVRFMDLKDTFSASGTGGVLGNSNWTSQVENDIWGPQLGFRWTRQHRFMRISLENRFTAGINWQRSRLTGQLATEIQNGANEPAALSSSSFNDELDDTEFTPINELRADVAFRVNHWLGLRLGYSAMLIGNMSRASHKVVYELPTFGLNDDGTRDTLFASAFTFGVELNR